MAWRVASFYGFPAASNSVSRPRGYQSKLATSPRRRQAYTGRSNLQTCNPSVPIGTRVQTPYFNLSHFGGVLSPGSKASYIWFKTVRRPRIYNNKRQEIMGFRILKYTTTRILRNAAMRLGHTQTQMHGVYGTRPSTKARVARRQNPTKGIARVARPQI